MKRLGPLGCWASAEAASVCGEEGPRRTGRGARLGLTLNTPCWCLDGPDACSVADGAGGPETSASPAPCLHGRLTVTSHVFGKVTQASLLVAFGRTASCRTRCFGQAPPRERR